MGRPCQTNQGPTGRDYSSTPRGTPPRSPASGGTIVRHHVEFRRRPTRGGTIVRHRVELCRRPTPGGPIVRHRVELCRRPASRRNYSSTPRGTPPRSPAPRRNYSSTPRGTPPRSPASGGTIVRHRVELRRAAPHWAELRSSINPPDRSVFAGPEFFVLSLTWVATRLYRK